MNRRAFLKSTAAVALASLVPTWMLPRRRAVNLEPFCAQPHDLVAGRYEVRTPFVQGDFRFATNGKICLRVDAEFGDCDGAATKRPPALGLPWRDDWDGGWQPWPEKRHELAEDTECPVCDGIGRKPARVCSECNGDGCLECSGGYLGPICLACNGGGFGLFPGVQRLDRSFFVASCFDSKIRRHLGECEWRAIGQPHIIEFRFDGGRGLLMPMDHDRTLERLTKAKT